MRTDHLIRRRKSHQHRLEERDPALINLPIPVPSIPLLNPIVTPLIAGTPLPDIGLPTLFPHSSTHTVSVPPPPSPPPTPTPQSPSQEQPQPQPQTQPQAQPTSQPGPGSSSSPPLDNQPGNSGQQSSPGDGGGSGAGDNSNGQGSDGNTGNGSDGSGGGSNGATTGPGSSQGQPPANASPSLSLGDSNEGDSDTSIITSTSTGADGKPTPIVIAGNGSTESGDGPGISPTGPHKPAFNVGANPNATGGGADSVPFGNTTPSVTYSPLNPSGTPGHGDTSTAGTHGNGQGDINGGGNSPGGPSEIGPSGATSPDPGHHGLSKGAVAAIVVIVALLLVSLLILACRRRAISRRISRRRWWSKSMYGAPISSSGYFRQNMAPSIRSSFGTNFEHEPIPSSPQPMPSSDWPLTPQTTQTHTTFPITFPPAMPTAASSPSPTIRSRESGDNASFVSRHSLSSTSSDYAHLPAPQVVLIPARRDDVSEQREHSPITPKVGTPISVRPFSPSERWSFPKPPPHDRDPNSERDGCPDAYPATPSPAPDSINTSLYVTAPESVDPFTDPDSESTDVHTTESFTTTDTTGVHFASQETVCRSFIPTLNDEIRVEPGDAVRVLRRFDDGWAYAENRNTGSKGLFPIDCLRMAEQELPAFLAAKRLSSYTSKPLSRRLSRMTAVQEHQAQG